MPPSDDVQIGNATHVLRVLLPRWVVTKNGRERPTSDSLLDSNFENSCFIASEISLTELRALFPDFPNAKIAQIPVQVLRDNGYAIERKPEDAPGGCMVPNSHVVVGPPTATQRGPYEAAARRIVKHGSIRIIQPDEIE